MIYKKRLNICNQYIYIIKFSVHDKEIATLEKDDECGLWETTEDELNQILLRLSMDLLSDAKATPIKDGGVIPENSKTNIDLMYTTIGLAHLSEGLVPNYIVFAKYESGVKYNVSDDNEKRRMLDDIAKEFGSIPKFMEEHLYKFTDVS